MKKSINDDDFMTEFLFENDRRREHSKRVSELGKVNAYMPNSAYNNNKQNLIENNNNENYVKSKEQIKNERLVCLLKHKMFKGFMKVQLKDERIKSEARDITALYVNGKKFNVKRKKLFKEKEPIKSEEVTFLKIEKYPDEKLYENILKDDDIKNNKYYNKKKFEKLNLNLDMNVKYRTASAFYNKDDLLTNEDKILKKIFNNNLDEARHFNSVAFISFQVNQTKENAHGKLNRSILESEILLEIERINKANSETENQTKENFFMTNKTEGFNIIDFEKRIATSKKKKNSNISNYNNSGLHKTTQRERYNKSDSALSMYLKQNRKLADNSKRILSHIPNIENNHSGFNSINKNKKFKSTMSSFFDGKYNTNTNNNTIINYNLHAHVPSSFFTTNLNEKIHMSHYADHKFPKKIENQKLFDKLKNRDTSSDLMKNNIIRELTTISAQEGEGDNEKNEEGRVLNFPLNSNNKKEKNNVLKTKQNIRPGTHSYRSNIERQYYSEFDDLMINVSRNNQNKFKKEASITSNEKTQLNLITDKKERFKKMKEFVFDVENEGVDKQNNNKVVGNFHRTYSLFNQKRGDKLKTETLNEQIRDYKVSKQMYKIFDKNDVDVKILGKENKNKNKLL